MPTESRTTAVEDADRIQAWMRGNFESGCDDVRTLSALVCIAVRMCRQAVENRKSTPAREAQAVFADNLLGKLREEMDRGD